jgi:hypothetical protein
MPVMRIPSAARDEEDHLDCEYQLSTGNMSVKYMHNRQLDGEEEEKYLIMPTSC